MFLFREHRGSLSASMQTVMTMDTFNELESHIHNVYGKGEIIVKHYTYDRRIKWNTHIVTLDGNAVGFTNRYVGKEHEQSKKNS